MSKISREEFESILEEAYIEGYNTAIEKLFNESFNELSWKYVKPLQNINYINVFTKAHKVKLPSELIKIIKNYNGGRPNKNLFDTNKSKECVFKSLLSFNPNDSESIYKIYKKDSDTKFNKMGLFPFGITPNGDFICIDSTNKIVLLKTEDMSVELISGNISGFINTLY